MVQHITIKDMNPHVKFTTPTAAALPQAMAAAVSAQQQHHLGGGGIINNNTKSSHKFVVVSHSTTTTSASASASGSGTSASALASAIAMSLRDRAPLVIGHRGLGANTFENDRNTFLKPSAAIVEENSKLRRIPSSAGGGGVYRENSLRSCVHASKIEGAFIEVDCQLTKDGSLVLWHDDHVCFGKKSGRDNDDDDNLMSCHQNQNRNHEQVEEEDEEEGGGLGLLNCAPFSTPKRYMNKDHEKAMPCTTRRVGELSNADFDRVYDIASASEMLEGDSANTSLSLFRRYKMHKTSTTSTTSSSSSSHGDEDSSLCDNRLAPWTLPEDEQNCIWIENNANSTITNNNNNNDTNEMVLDKNMSFPCDEELPNVHLTSPPTPTTASTAPTPRTPLACTMSQAQTLSQSQPQAIRSTMKRSRRRRSRSEGKITSLHQLLSQTPTSLGINIEIKIFRDGEDADRGSGSGSGSGSDNDSDSDSDIDMATPLSHEEMTANIENLVNAIYHTVQDHHEATYKTASACGLEAQWRPRKIFYSSFSPDACICMQNKLDNDSHKSFVSSTSGVLNGSESCDEDRDDKDPVTPSECVFFLTDGMPHHVDERRRSLSAAAKFAHENHLSGIVCEASALLSEIDKSSESTSYVSAEKKQQRMDKSSDIESGDIENDNDTNIGDCCVDDFDNKNITSNNTNDATTSTTTCGKNGLYDAVKVKGLTVASYGVDNNNELNVKKQLENGVCAIITDFPAELKNVLSV